MSSDIADDFLEQSVCQVLSLTGISVEPDDLQACHRIRKKDCVIIKFKYRKQKHRVLLNRKTLQNKNLDLTQLKFSGKLFVNQSIIRVICTSVGLQMSSVEKCA